MDSEVTTLPSGVEVLYEDNHIIVAIKPAGVLSQSDGSNSPDMLTILKAYIKEKYEKRVKAYFLFTDKRNSMRVYDAIRRLPRKV